jgi:hypothetical protein
LGKAPGGRGGIGIIIDVAVDLSLFTVIWRGMSCAAGD